jgi:hypothetical protein
VVQNATGDPNRQVDNQKLSFENSSAKQKLAAHGFPYAEFAIKGQQLVFRLGTFDAQGIDNGLRNERHVRSRINQHRNVSLRFCGS